MIPTKIETLRFQALQKKGDSPSRGQRETRMIPPHEIKNKDFTKAMRGYSTTEVDEYISYVIEKYTELYRENDDLERRLKTVTDQLNEIKKEEESIRNALINAQKAAKKIVNDAHGQANEIKKQAHADCQAVLASFEDKFAREDKILSHIKAGVQDFKAEFFEKYRRHIECIEEILPEPASDSMPNDDAHREHAQTAANAIRTQLNEEFPQDFGEIAPEASNTMVFNKVQTVTLEEAPAKAAEFNNTEKAEQSAGFSEGQSNLMDDEDFASFAQSKSKDGRKDVGHKLTPTEEFELVYPDDASAYEESNHRTADKK